MDILNIEKTNSSPKVILDKDNNTFEIAGKSLPENVSDFYKPILEWLDAYAQSPNPQTKFVMKFTYFNTASSKCILDIIFKLKEMRNTGTEVLISWHYIEGKDEMLETGEEYADIAEVPFEYVSYKP